MMRSIYGSLSYVLHVGIFAAKVGVAEDARGRIGCRLRVYTPTLPSGRTPSKVRSSVNQDFPTLEANNILTR